MLSNVYHANYLKRIKLYVDQKTTKSSMHKITEKSAIDILMQNNIKTNDPSIRC
jgi:hypothetical protein